MLTKLMLFLFCGALINAKSLMKEDPRLRVVEKEEVDHVKFPSVFKGFMQGLENSELEPREYVKVGANPEVQFNDKESDEEFVEKLDTDPNPDDPLVPETGNKFDKADKNDEKERVAGNHEDDDDDDDDDDDNDNNEGDEKTQDDTKQDDTKDEADDESVEEESEEENDAANVDKTKNEEHPEDRKEEINNDDDENDSDDEESSQSEDQKPSNTKNFFANAPKSQLLGTSLGSENLYQDSLKFAKSYIDSLISASQNPENKKLANTVANFLHLKSLTKNVNLESLMKNILPMKKSSPKHADNEEKDLFNLDQDSLMEQIQTWENENKMEQSDSNDSVFNLDDPSVGSFIPQSFPKSLEDLQKNFRRFANFWKKTPGNVNFKQPIQKEPKVGFGGWNAKKQPVFGNFTTYVNKAVNQAQAQLEKNGRSIEAKNPPLTINVIPGLPIIVNLKRVEGAHTLDTYGQSKGIHFNKLYAFTQYKFTELRYYYEVIIKPLNLFGIRKSITIILNEAPAKMSVTVEKDNSMKIMGMEFVHPEVSLDVGSHRYVNYGINYLLNEYLHPVVRQKLVEIVSRDSKLLLTKYLQDAQ